MRSFIWKLENNTNMHSKKLKQDTVGQLVYGMIIIKWLQIICLLVCVLGNCRSRYNLLSSCCTRRVRKVKIHHV